ARAAAVGALRHRARQGHRPGVAHGPQGRRGPRRNAELHPHRAGEPLRAAAAAGTGSGPRRMSTSLLLIDDDRTFSTLAGQVLEQEGFTVRLARSLHGAREALTREAPDLVVLDRRLPDG